MTPPRRRSSRSLRLRAAAHVLATLATGGAALAIAGPVGAANFRGLFDDASYDEVAPERVNAEGDQIVGNMDPTFTGQPDKVAAVWDEDSHDRSQPGPATIDTRDSRATGQELSADGMIRRTVGWSDPGSPAPGSDPDEAWVRVEDANLATDTTTYLPRWPAATNANRLVDVSRDGDRLGQYEDLGVWHAFHYAEETGTHTAIVDFTPADLSANGIRAVGTSTASPKDQAAIWFADTGVQELIGPLPGGTEAAAIGISASGRIVVGASESSNLAQPGREAFRYHPDFGMQTLEPIPLGESRESKAWATSDANVVVGEYHSLVASAERAFVWTPETGRVDLASWLTNTYGLGAALSGWTLTRAKSISADGNVIVGEGVNPDGDPQGWVVDLTDEDVAVVELRPSIAPTDWDLFVTCGDDALSEVSFGLVQPDPFAFDGGFDFADCTNPATVGGLPALDCAGASGIGGTVSTDSTVVLPQEDNGFGGAETSRAKTWYFTIEGNAGGTGNLLCEPGDGEVYLGYFFIDNQANAVPPEIIQSALSPTPGREGSGDYLPAERFRLRRSPEPGGFEIDVFQALDDTNGSQWMVDLTADQAVSKFSFGIILPPTLGGSVVSFGDCNEALVGAFSPRGCADGDDLGKDVDFDLVRTLGPDPGLTAFGMRPDTLYVYVEGGLAGGGTQDQMNVANKRARLGRFSFDGVLSADPAFVPTYTVEGVENFDLAYGGAADWEDASGADLTSVVYLTGGNWEPNTGLDWDADGYDDAVDKCPYVPSTQADGGTLEQITGGPDDVLPTDADGVGDECQCGDAQDDNMVVGLDIETLRSVLANPELGPTMTAAAKAKCNSVGPVFGDIDPATQLPYDCNVNDVFVLLKALQGGTPLIPAPGEAPACPDVTTP